MRLAVVLFLLTSANLKTLGRNQGNAGEHSFDNKFTPLLNACSFKFGAQKQWHFCGWMFFNGRLKHHIAFKIGCHFFPSAFESSILNLYGRHQKKARRQTFYTRSVWDFLSVQVVVPLPSRFPRAS